MQPTAKPLRELPSHNPGAWGVLGGGAFALVFIACAASIHHRVGLLGFCSDDSYIYTGYVKMAFTPGGGLFSYDVGEHSAGTTGILFYYLLCGSYWLLTFVMQPGPAALVMNSWMDSGICFIASGAVIGISIARVCRVLGITNRRAVGLWVLFGLSLVCASGTFLWGQLSGMENPLSALLVISLAVMAVDEKLHILRFSALAAALIATRPDWAPIAVFAPMVALFGPGPARGRLRQCAFGYVVFGLILAILFVPLRIATGQWQPSALGARVQLRLVDSLGNLMDAIGNTFDNLWGRTAIASWIMYGLFYSKSKVLPGLILIPFSITLFLLTRAAMNLHGFSVHDRYVSYLWPPMCFLFIAMLISLGRGWLAPLAQGTLGHIAALFIILITGRLFVLGTTSAVASLTEDTIEMLEVHVRPSQWMSTYLPANTVVAMEPAGALRTYTDFNLVDQVGLTTSHFQRFQSATGQRPNDDLHAFFQTNHVQYLFDYPARIAIEGNPGRLTIIKEWNPTRKLHSGGRIALMRVEG